MGHSWKTVEYLYPGRDLIRRSLISERFAPNIWLMTTLTQDFHAEDSLLKSSEYFYIYMKKINKSIKEEPFKIASPAVLSVPPFQPRFCDLVPGKFVFGWNRFPFTRNYSSECRNTRAALYLCKTYHSFLYSLYASQIKKYFGKNKTKKKLLGVAKWQWHFQNLHSTSR